MDKQKLLLLAVLVVILSLLRVHLQKKTISIIEIMRFITNITLRVRNRKIGLP